jgi:hypothetical protein
LQPTSKLKIIKAGMRFKRNPIKGFFVMEVGGKERKTPSIDHHGIVAVYKDQGRGEAQ